MTFSDKIKSLIHLISVDSKLAFQILVRRNTRKSWLKKKNIDDKVNGLNFRFDFELSKMVMYMYTILAMPFIIRVLRQVLEQRM